VGIILLDLDGTLTDAREGIERCLRCALRSVGLTVPCDSDLTRYSRGTREWCGFDWSDVWIWQSPGAGERRRNLDL
jgi:phosphoglycolate phosphatase-like HAD superfamily hydrolase